MFLTGRIAREWMLKYSRLIKIINTALLQSSYITSFFHSFFHSLAERDLDHFEHGGTPITHHSAALGQMGTPLANVAAAFFAAPFVFASRRSRQAFQTCGVWAGGEIVVPRPSASALLTDQRQKDRKKEKVRERESQAICISRIRE
jgi:hypothetical protein